MAIRISITPAANLAPTVDPSAPHRSLPCRADRQKIIEHAELVLAEARAIARQWDGSLALLSAQQPAECTNAAASSFLAAGTPGTFLGDVAGLTRYAIRHAQRTRVTLAPSAMGEFPD